MYRSFTMSFEDEFSLSFYYTMTIELKAPISHRMPVKGLTIPLMLAFALYSVIQLA